MRAYLLASVLILVVFGSISTYLYQRFSALAAMDFSPPPVAVNSEVAQATMLQRTVKTVGTVRSLQSSVLAAEVSGRVLNIAVTGGQTVQAGDVLIQLDDRIEQAELARYRADMRLASTLLTRDRALASEQAISQTALDTAVASFEVAQAQVNETLARIEQKRIVAPFSGTVGVPSANEGDYVSAGMPLIQIADTTKAEVTFALPIDSAQLIAIGNSLIVQSSSDSTRVEGVVTESDPMLNAQDRTRRFRASLAAATLLPGEFVRIELPLDTPESTVTVSETAITYALQGAAVYVIDDSQTPPIAQLRMVTVGDTQEGRVEVVRGLEIGETVVSAGQHKLFSGAQVVINEDSPL